MGRLRKQALMVCAGSDCIGSAQTGSGKTIAFAIPILQALARDPYGPFALVLTPTRYAPLSNLASWTSAHAPLCRQRARIPNLRAVPRSWREHEPPLDRCRRRNGHADAGHRAQIPPSCHHRHSRAAGRSHPEQPRRVESESRQVLGA